MPLHRDGDRLTAISEQPRTWQIRFVDRLLDQSPDTARDLFTLPTLNGAAPPPPTRAVIIDDTLSRLYRSDFADLFKRYGLDPIWLVTYGGESNKTIAPVLELAENILRLHLDRRAQPIIAIGGGVTTDIASFLAGIVKRGVPLIRIPTSLVGQADAGIAAKTGVNHADSKNALGTYDPAALTLIDYTLLSTLPTRHLANGLAEIAKAALMHHPGLWQRLADHGADLLTLSMQMPVGRSILFDAVEVMLTELADNRREMRLQRTMDFGHAITPTLEMLSQEDTLHGEWVAIDMAVFVEISSRRNLISPGLRDHIYAVLRSLGLELWHPLLNETPRLEQALASTTRHRGGRQHIPLLRGIGQPSFVDDISLSELRQACDRLRQV